MHRDVGVRLLQVSADTHDGAARPYARHEGVGLQAMRGELRLEVREKDPTVVQLNRQEIFLEPRNSGATEWHASVAEPV